MLADIPAHHTARTTSGPWPIGRRKKDIAHITCRAMPRLGHSAGAWFCLQSRNGQLDDIA